MHVRSVQGRRLLHGIGATSVDVDTSPTSTQGISNDVWVKFAPAKAQIRTANLAAVAAVDYIKQQLHPPGTTLFEETADYWKVIQYPESVYACNAENVKKVTFRDDLWKTAQMNLARLRSAVEKPPFTYPPPEMGTPDRRYWAATIADWYTTTMTWVSIAMYATNIQPAFLLADPPTSADAGALKPKRSAEGGGLPSGLNTLRNELKAFVEAPGAATQRFDANKFVTDWIDSEKSWGPMWMGFYDRAEATGWLTADFRLQPDPIAKELAKNPAGVTTAQVYPSRAVKFQPDTTNFVQVRDKIADPWWQVYLTACYFDQYELLGWWTQKNTVTDSLRDQNLMVHYVMFATGSFIRIGRSWCDFVLNQTVMDTIVRAVIWYQTDYFQYWNKKGLLTYPVSRAKSELKLITANAQTAKLAQTMGIIDGVGGTVSAALAAVPYAGAIAAGCTMLAKGIAALVMRRRRKKALQVPVMNSIMLRQLSDPQCSFFRPDETLEGGLLQALAAVRADAANLNSAPAGVVPPIASDDPLATGTYATGVPIPGLTTDPTLRPQISVPPTSGSTTATATNPNGQSGPIVPSAEQIRAATVQEMQGRSGDRTAPDPNQIPTPILIGGAAAAAALLIIAVRRRG